MNALMTEQGMRDFTDEQRDSLVEWASETRQIAQIIQARLANTQVDGDSAGTAARRARKVTRPLRKVVRLLEKTAAEMEAFNAVYVRDVLELPDRRVKDRERKALRRQRLGIAASGVQEQIAGSLNSSVNILHGIPGATNPQVTPLAQAPQYHTASPSYAYPAPPAQAPMSSIADIFTNIGETG
jgi:hypothetical protein